MDIGKLILVGGAAFVGYQFMKPKEPVTSATGAGVQPPSTPPPTSNVVPATKAMIRTAAGSLDNATADAWGWYYHGARNVDAPAPETYLSEADRFKNLSLDEWWALVSQHGVSGMGYSALDAPQGGWPVLQGGVIRRRM